jgi:hypothetical protein
LTRRGSLRLQPSVSFGTAHYGLFGVGEQPRPGDHIARERARGAAKSRASPGQLTLQARDRLENRREARQIDFTGEALESQGPPSASSLAPPRRPISPLVHRGSAALFPTTSHSEDQQWPRWFCGAIRPSSERTKTLRTTSLACYSLRPTADQREVSGLQTETRVRGQRPDAQPYTRIGCSSGEFRSRRSYFAQRSLERSRLGTLATADGSALSASRSCSLTKFF